MARNKYPEETVERILDTSMKLFLEKGYERTSIQDIINNLGGLTKGAIYHHFKSKEDIMLAVMDRMFIEHDETWLILLRDGEEVPALERLRKMIRFSLESPKLIGVFSAAPNMLANSKMLTLQMEGIFPQSAPFFIKPIIEQGIEDGSIQVKYPLQLAEVLLLLMNLWLTPMVNNAEVEVMRDRFFFFQEMLRKLGLDIVDDDLLVRFEELCEAYNQKK